MEQVRKRRKLNKIVENGKNKEIEFYKKTIEYYKKETEFYKKLWKKNNYVPPMPKEAENWYI